MNNFEFSKTYTLRDKNFNITSNYYIVELWKTYPEDILVKFVSTKNNVTLIRKAEPTSNTNIVSVRLDDIYFITNENFTEVDADFFRTTSTNIKNASKVLEEELRKYTKPIPHLDVGIDDHTLDSISYGTLSEAINKPGLIVDNQPSVKATTITLAPELFTKEEASKEIKLLSRIKNKLTINLSKVFKAIENGIIIMYYGNTKMYFKNVTLGFNGKDYYLTSQEMLKFFRVDRVPLKEYKITWFLKEDLEDKND